jgi:hypothetical protein
MRTLPQEGIKSQSAKVSAVSCEVLVLALKEHAQFILTYREKIHHKRLNINEKHLRLYRWRGASASILWIRPCVRGNGHGRRSRGWQFYFSKRTFTCVNSPPAPRSTLSMLTLRNPASSAHSPVFVFCAASRIAASSPSLLPLEILNCSLKI